MDLTRGDLPGGDQADPRTAGQPADVGVIAGGFGVAGELIKVAPEDNDLVLRAAAGAAGEKLAKRQWRTLVERAVQVIAGHIVNGENFQPIDFIETVPRGAQSVAPAEPLDEVTHLVGEGVAVPHALDHGQGLVIQDALGRPEDAAGGGRLVVAVDGIEEFFRNLFVRKIELREEIFRHVVGEGRADEGNFPCTNQCLDHAVEAGSVVVRPGAGIRVLGPLQGGSERRGDV